MPDDNQSRTGQIENAFTCHRPSEGAVGTMTGLRDEAKILAHMIDLGVPEGREKAAALSKLEEAVMWANAGIVRSA